MRDIDRIKHGIDSLRENCAVAVKGRAFPLPEGAGASSDGRFVFIEASSYAMANSLEISHHFKKDQHQWYIDRRIVRRIPGLAHCVSCKKIKLLPKNRARRIYAYDNLWKT